MADGELSSFASELLPEGAPAFGGGYSLGVDTALQLPPGLQLPAPIEPGAQPSGFSRFASQLGAGLEKEFTTTPLKGFSEALSLPIAGFGIANQLRTAGALNRQTQQIEHGQKAAQAAAAPAVSFGEEQLAAARAGKLPGPMEAAVEQWKQQAKADMRARLASMGLGNSTDLQGEEAKIDLMGESMKAQLLQGQEKVGLEGLQVGVSAATGGAATAQNQEVLLTNLITGANQQLAKLGASSA